MKKVTILLLMLSMAFMANAQRELPTFPDVKVEDLKKKEYAKDSSAEAYIMMNYGNGWVYKNSEGGYEIAYQYFTRIKVLKKSAFERATKTLFLYKDDNQQNIETIENVKGRTYNFANDGITIEELDPKDIFKGKYDKSYDKVSFTLPKVKEGSIIEYSYVVRSPYPFKPKDWYFQYNIPCERSEYTFSSPTNLAYRILMQACEGKLSFDKCATADEYRTCQWLMLNVPALNREKYVANLDDYTRKIHFELAEYIVDGMSKPKNLSMDWPAFDKQLLIDEDLGGRISKISAFEATAQSLKSQKTDTLELAKEVYKYVQSNFTWDGNKYLFTKNPLKEVFKNKTGSGTELNLLLISLLRQVGIEANPVVISTREHGRIWKEYPMITRFNYTLAHVKIKGKDVLLDVTDKNLRWGLLPSFCMVGEGRLLISNKSQWLPIRTPEKSGEMINMEFTFGEKESELESQITYAGVGYQAIDYRTEYNTLGKDKFAEKFRKKLSTIDKALVEFEGFSNTDTDVQPVIAVTGKNPEGYSVVNGKIYLKTIPYGGTTEHPFVSADRAFPIDFTYPTEETITCKYTIPDNYAVVELPKAIRVTLPEDGGRFNFSVAQYQGGKVIIVTSQIQLKKSIYGVDEYQAIRTVYDHIVAKHNEMIVLQKK